MTEEREYLTYEEAGARFSVSEATVRSWARARLIKRYRRPTDKRVYVRVSEIERMRSGEFRQVEE